MQQKVNGMKILAIAPYEGLKELITQLAKKEKLDITTEIGDLNQGLSLAKAAKKQGFDIIISRGGTAELIQRELSIPVVEIEVSGYDMLRVLTLVKKYPGKTAIVGFEQIAEGAAAVCEILNISMSSYKVKQEQDISAILENLKLNGYQNIIGDAVTIKMAQSAGLNGILLTSGKESVMKAFRNAEKVYGFYQKIKETYSLPYQLIEQSDLGIAVYDANKTRIYSNSLFNEQVTPNMQEQLQVLLGSQVGEKHVYLLSDAEAHWKVLQEQLNRNDEQITVFKLERLGVNEKNQAGVLTSIGDEKRNNGLTFLSKNEKVQKIFTFIQNSKQVNSCIWINGEKGTGKEYIASYIHASNMHLNSSYLITFDCELMTKETWLDWLSRLDTENGKKTVFIKNIEYLTIELQRVLYRFVKEHKEECFFIISCSQNIFAKIQTGEFLESLHQLLSDVSFVLPPLRERKEDIEGMASVFINEQNLRYGKQVVGLRQEAKEYLEQGNWPGNINQLKQTINNGVLFSNGYYLEIEDVAEVMQGEPAGVTSDLTLTGTLDEIEKSIIQKVWLEEGKNQTKTAERLGINRTTLWRKLKE